MSALRELQVDMMRALHGRTNRAARHVLAHGLDPERRLDVYRRNVAANLGDALAAVYPTVVRLVGADFFGHLGREYAAAHPPRSGNVHDFGDALPPFVAAFGPAASLPYLADVARLEWAWHTVYHATAAPPLDAAEALQRVAALPPQRQGALRLRLQPASAGIASRWPVFAIWRANLEADPPAVDLDDGPQQVLVIQRRGEVVVEPLEPAELALLEALASRATLAEAIAEAFTTGERLGTPGNRGAPATPFDAAGALMRHLHAGTFVALDAG